LDLTAKTFRPEPVRHSREQRDYLPVETLNNVFELMHPPLAWELVGSEWLPILSPIHFQKGVNNYDDHGTVDPEAVRTIFRRKGCACILPEDARLGEFMHYIGTVPATNPKFNSYGKYYLTIFESPEMVAGQVVWRRDMAEFNRFRKHLVTVGICVMSSTIAELVIRAKRTTLATLEQVPVTTDVKKARLVAMREEITRMEAALPGLAGPAKAAVRRKFTPERAPGHGEE